MTDWTPRVSIPAGIAFTKRAALPHSSGAVGCNFRPCACLPSNCPLPQRHTGHPAIAVCCCPNAARIAERDLPPPF